MNTFVSINKYNLLNYYTRAEVWLASIFIGSKEKKYNFMKSICI